jgi:hypothetical protein
MQVQCNQMTPQSSHEVTAADAPPFRPHCAVLCAFWLCIHRCGQPCVHQVQPLSHGFTVAAAHFLFPCIVQYCEPSDYDFSNAVRRKDWLECCDAVKNQAKTDLDCEKAQWAPTERGL